MYKENQQRSRLNPNINSWYCLRSDLPSVCKLLQPVLFSQTGKGSWWKSCCSALWPSCDSTESPQRLKLNKLEPGFYRNVHVGRHKHTKICTYAKFTHTTLYVQECACSQTQTHLTLYVCKLCSPNLICTHTMWATVVWAQAHNCTAQL